MGVTESLTLRQREILDFLVATIRTTGLPPTIREIGSRMGMNSTNGVFRHLRALEQKGYIRHDPDKARSIHIVGYQEICRLNERLQRIPIFGSIPAGRPDFADQAGERHLEVDSSVFGPDASFALEVHGDSMIEAGIREGDLVIVRAQQTASHGDIVVALIGENATVKRFERRGDDLVLKPENSAMQPMVYPPGSDGFSIQGKVVGVVRRYL